MDDELGDAKSDNSTQQSPNIAATQSMDFTHERPDEESTDIAEDTPLLSDKESASDKEGENMNVRAAIIHMVGDMIQSLGVIVAALIIYFKPEWKIADPICTFLFSILVMITTVPIFIDCMRILMESSPSDIETLDLYNAILKVSDQLKWRKFELF